ncbi:MAG: hypothetical protein C0629_14530 [Chromatiales bacterium]|nr:MAG: hypothetical protein C0629_14530 [Chromatiales bacterium]
MRKRLTGLVLLTFIGGCNTHTEVPVSETYESALARTSALPAVAPESAQESAAIARLQDFLAAMSADGIRADIRNVYAQNVFFNDTLKTVVGVDALEEYLLETVQRTSFVRVRFDDVVRSGHDYYLRWFMEYQSDRINDGAVVSSIGMSQIRFDDSGKVVLHQDYWDSTGGLFERAPVVGWLLRKIKARL